MTIKSKIGKILQNIQSHQYYIQQHKIQNEKVKELKKKND